MAVRFSGTKDVEIELMPNNAVRITTRYKTAYEAAIAYDEIAAQAKKGTLAIKFSLGDILEEY